MINSYKYKAITAKVSEDISVEMDVKMKTVTIFNQSGDYVTLSEREFTDLIGVVGSHAWAYGNKGVEDESKKSN